MEAPSYQYLNSVIFEKIAQGALGLAGLQFNDSSKLLNVEEVDWMFAVHGQDSSGQLDLEVRQHNDGNGYGVINTGLVGNGVGGNQFWYLNGLLRKEDGYFTINLNPEEAGSSYPLGINQCVSISAVSSVKAINETQELLGRTPGKDAIKLTVTRGRVLYAPGEWIESFGDGFELGISDTSNWDLTVHDRDAEDHIQGWLGTPTSILKQASARARVIKKEYGKRIHLPKEDRPLEVGSFIWALDTLKGYTRTPMSLMLNLGYEPRVRPALKDVHYWVEGQTGHWNLFQRLGLIRADRTDVDSHGAQININKQFISHIARLCLNLDEVKPKEGIAKRTRAARTKMLQNVISEYSLAA